MEAGTLLFHALPKELNQLLTTGLKRIYLLRDDDAVLGSFYSIQDAIFASLENHDISDPARKNVYDADKNIWLYATRKRTPYTYFIEEVELSKYVDRKAARPVYLVLDGVLIKMIAGSYEFSHSYQELNALKKIMKTPRSEVIKKGMLHYKREIAIDTSFKFDYPPLASFDLPRKKAKQFVCKPCPHPFKKTTSKCPGSSSDLSCCDSDSDTCSISCGNPCIYSDSDSCTDSSSCDDPIVRVDRCYKDESIDNKIAGKKSAENKTTGDKSVKEISSQHPSEKDENWGGR